METKAVDTKRIITVAIERDVLSEAIIVLAVLEVGMYVYPQKDQSIFIIEEELSQQVMLRSEGMNQHTLPTWAESFGKYWLVNTNHQDFPKKYKGRWLAEISRHYWCKETGNDFAGIVYAYRAYKDLESKKRNYGTDSLDQWCRRWFLKFGKMKKIDEAISRLMQEFGLASDVSFPREFNDKNLTQAILAGSADYVGRIQKIGSRVVYRSYEGPLGSFRTSNMSVCPLFQEWIVTSVPQMLLRTTEADVDDWPVAEFAAPIDQKWLLDFHRDSFQSVRSGMYRYLSDRDVVVEEKTFLFKNLEITKYEKTVQDKAVAAKVFCDWVVCQITEREIQLRSTGNPAFDEAILCNRKRFPVFMKGRCDLTSASALLPTKDELRKELNRVLDGAVSVGTISNLEALKFLTIDKTDLAKKLSGNQTQWINWKTRPHIPHLHLSRDNPVLPPIVTAEYGVCLVTEKSLIAYGSLNDKLETKWFKRQSDAEAFLAEAKKRLRGGTKKSRHKKASLGKAVKAL